MSLYKQTIFFAIVLLLSSCKGTKEKDLVKTWKLDNMVYVTPLPPEMEASVSDIIEQQKAYYTLVYNADGTYEAIMGSDRLKGIWSLNWNATKVTVTGGDGVAKTYQITELNNDKYSFKMKIPALEKGGTEQELQFFMSPKN